MITVVNKTNKGLYNQLFEDVQNWLYTHDAAGQELFDDDIMGPTALLGKVPGEDPVTGEAIEVPGTINSLEELFQYMSFITNDQDARIYTRLPLDEEPFFIDANKRTITVPSDFATNGVSVQGDDISEILFFKINRFFDATDLNTCQIYIQWKSSEVDSFGNQKEGVSRPWIQDIKSEPGYILFGWPISSAITKEAGTVTFSVRFYRIDPTDKSLLYSFSTLDQTVTIKPALDYDIEDIAKDTSHVYVEDMTSHITLRAIDSPASDGASQASIPEWEPGVVENLTGYRQEMNEDDTVKYQIMNLNLDDDGFSTQPISLYIAALSEDAGVVTYRWQKIKKVNDQEVATIYMADDTTQFWKPIDYRVNNDSDSERIPEKIYYRKINDQQFKSIAPSTSLDELRENGEDVYELVSTAILDEVGKYIASARNRSGKAFSDYKVADTIYIPAPIEPIIGTLETKESTGPILNSEEEVELSLSVELQDEFGKNVENVGGVATYVWHRRALGESTPEDLEDNDATLILTDPETEEGYYSVTVTNNLNKKAASTSSNEIRITKAAVKPVLSIEEEDDVALSRALVEGLPVYVNGLEEHREDYEGGPDKLSYQWYAYREAGNNVEQDKANAKNGLYVVNGDVKISELPNIEAQETVLASSISPTFFPPAGVEATYFCVVTNHYNGTTNSVASPFYHVTL